MRQIKSLTILWGCYQGGVETAILNRARSLNELGCEAHVFFYFGGNGLSQFREIPCKVSNDAGELVRYIRIHGFDVITFINTLHNVLLLEEIEFQGKVLFEMDGFTLQIFEELNRINQGQEGQIVDAVVVPGDYVASMARAALWKRPDLPIIVARNTVDFNLFQHKSWDDFWMEAGIPENWRNCPLIGWVGRISREKGWRPLLRITKLLKRRYPKLKVLIVGDISISGEYREFRKAVPRNKLKSFVHVIGNVEHSRMPEFYSLIADSGGLLLSTSFTEGYPFHLLEAQACGCPIVCTNIGGSTEVVSYGATGLIYNIGDDHWATLEIERVIDNNELRQSLVAEALEQVQCRCDVETNTEAYTRAIEQLVFASSSPEHQEPRRWLLPGQ